MKKYNIFAIGKSGKKINMSWGYTKLDDHGSTVKVIIRPLICSREMASSLQQKIILALRSAGLKVEKEYKKVERENFKKIGTNT